MPKKPEKEKRQYHKTKKESFWVHLSPDTKRTLVVVSILAIAFLTLMGFTSVAGNFGVFWTRAILLLFGTFGYVLPVLLLFLAVALGWPRVVESFQGDWGKRTSVGAILMFLSLVGGFHILASKISGIAGLELAKNGGGAGLLGAALATPVGGLFGFWAGVLIFLVFLCIGFLITFNIALFVKREKVVGKTAPESTLATNAIKINSPQDANFTTSTVETANVPKPTVPTTPVTSKPAIKPEAGLPDAVVLEERRDWKLPPFDLLDDHKSEVDSGNIEANVAIIQKTLADFGIEVEMGEVNVGPTVTQYTLRPATGVKLSQIAGLRNDLALSLAAHAIRMELPIPGKPLVGIEVPNKTSRTVGLREVLQTTDFINHGSKLAFALGRDVAGKAQITDLAKMPHLLIAGATGKGKSVALNAFIVSLLYRNTPQDIKFILVDPKRVEMTMYNGIPHLLTQPIVEPEKAVNALKWAVSEMDRRYKLLAESKKRNITDYNAGTSLPLSYIVIVVDELADLMAVAQADIEAAIVRLAQMARAVGIHLVLATQSPRTDIITGLIKANITSRIAFAVGSQIESRIILDMGGAESLLGNGDMLFISSEFNKPHRIQGAFVHEREIHKVVDFFKLQTGAVIYNDDIVEKPKHAFSIPGFESDGDDDELLAEAKDEVLRAGKASASFLQRRLKVGYARAARLLDLLEEQGIVGPGDGAKPREVYRAEPMAEGFEEPHEGAEEDIK